MHAETVITLKNRSAIEKRALGQREVSIYMSVDLSARPPARPPVCLSVCTYACVRAWMDEGMYV